MRTRSGVDRPIALLLICILITSTAASSRADPASAHQPSSEAGGEPAIAPIGPRLTSSGPGTTTLVSQAGGAQGNGDSFYPSISADGRYIAFESYASNLVAGDTNGVGDVFVYDRNDGSISRVSISTSAVQGNSDSFGAAISSDGRFIAFATSATNLADGITTPPGKNQVYLRDRSSGTTTLVSAGTAGTGGNGFVGIVRPVAVSSDAATVAYDSTATNLIAVDANGAKSDVFVWDRGTGTTTIVSVSTSGSQANSDSYTPTLSGDGRYVAFQSFATNLDGSTNGAGQIFARDRVQNATSLVSASNAGVQGNNESRNAAIASGGARVAFESTATNLTPDPMGFSVRNVFVRELGSAGTWRVSLTPSGEAPSGPSKDAAISSDGSRIAFTSNASFGPPNPSNEIYVFDAATTEFTQVSVSSGGETGNGFSANSSLSGDGLVTAFSSRATNLVSPPTSRSQIFVNVQTARTRAFGEDFPWTRGACAHCAMSKDPVNLGTGSLTAQATDLAMPGRVLGFAFTRWYNSADPRFGALGPGWTHSYDWKIVDRSAFIDLRRGDGRVDRYTRNPDGSYAPPVNVFDVLTKNGNGTFTLTLTSQVVYEFSTVGRLTRIHEPAGNEIGFTYTSGDLTGITDTAFRQVTLSYDTSHRLIELTDPLGRRVGYAYDGAGRLATVTDKIGNAAGQVPAQHQWKYAYDGATPWITAITDPDARVRVGNTYDVQGRLSQQRDGLNALTTIAYSAGQTVVTDPRSHATTYTFDSRMRVLTQSDVVGGSALTITYTYDAAGNRSSVTDRNGQTTDLTYDARGNLLTKTDPAPTVGAPRPVTTFTYDAKNNLARIDDAEGFATTITYDAASNVLLSVSRQIDAGTFAVTKYEYGDANNPGLPTRIIAPRGNISGTPDPMFATHLSYDLEGNLVSRTDPDAARTTVRYDAAGRLVSFVDPDGNAAGGVPAEHTWTVTYDENDRETRRSDPLGNVLGYGYDGAGNRTTLTDRSGNVTTYVYDANTRLTRVEQKPDLAGTYATTVTRDGNGNATRITQGNGVLTDYAFDVLDRLTSVTTHPAVGTDLTTSYVLDGNGQPTSRTTGDGVTVGYGYDSLSRLTSVSGPVSIAYTYDRLGRRTGMTDATGTTTYQYDGLGRLTQVAAPNGTLGYAYDPDGNRTSLMYPGGQAVAYAYSAGGRMTTVTDWAAKVSTYNYAPSGLVSRLAFPNGLVATYGYDRAQRLTDLQYTAVQGSVTLASQHFTLDPEGDRVALDEAALLQTNPPTLAVDHYTMTYDGLLRLTRLDGALFGGGTSSETFTYDAATNLSARTGPAATYSIDGANRATSDGARNFTWNGADRLVQRGADTFAYDALGRLTSSTVAGTTRTYAYDGDGLLSTRRQGNTTTFLWDTAVAPAALVRSDNDRVVHGLGPLYLVRQNGTTRTFVRDALGSVRGEANDAGVITRSFRYTAYGEIVQPNANVPTLLGFAGELRDPSGLIYLRARWYDPEMGRFLQRDPFPGTAATPSSVNGFNYADADPVLRIDPAGIATGAICVTASFSAGGYGTYQICPVAVDTAGNVGWTATIGAGLSPSLAVSATGGLQGSNAPRISDLAGPFTDVGGSAGALLVGGSDWFWSEDASIQGGSAQVGFGVRMTGLAPFEIHAATTNTKVGVFFNIFDLLRTVLRMGPKKG